MKNIFFICFCALFAFSGCADDDDDLLTGGNVDIISVFLMPNQTMLLILKYSRLLTSTTPDWKKLKNSTRQANIIMQPMLYWNTIEREPMLLIRTYL